MALHHGKMKGITPNGPADRIAAAERQARDTDQAVEAASAARLAETQKLAPRDRLRALEDPALVSTRRARLRRTLETALPIRSPFRGIMPTARSLRRLASRSLRLVFSTPALIAMSVGGPWLALTIGNTRPLALVTQSGMSGIPLADGSTIVVTLSPGVVYPILGARVTRSCLAYGRPGPDIYHSTCR